jgi:hypothetical protein
MYEETLNELKQFQRDYKYAHMPIVPYPVDEGSPYWYRSILKKKRHPDYNYVNMLVKHCAVFHRWRKALDIVYVTPERFVNKNPMDEALRTRRRVEWDDVLNASCWWCPSVLRYAADMYQNGYRGQLCYFDRDDLSKQMIRVLQKSEHDDMHQTKMLKVLLGYILMIIINLRKKKPKFIVELVLTYLL